MELFYLALPAVILFVFLVHLFANRHHKQLDKPTEDNDFDTIYDFIDESLRGYPNRTRYKDAYGTQVWSCDSRLFNFQIHLKKQFPGYEFEIYFFCNLPFRLKLKRSLTGEMKIAAVKGKKTKKLVTEKEFPALAQTLRFYDSAIIRGNCFRGIRRFSGVSGLAAWPRTLGSSITFVRFLINYSDRKEATKQDSAHCPYCKNLIVENDSAVSCRDCRTVHHQDCWNETDRCSVFGCGSKSELEI